MGPDWTRDLGGTVQQHLDRRQALKLLAALGAAGAASACAPAGGGGGSTSQAPVRIGLIAPQTGAYRAIGTEMINGFQLYLSLNNNELGGHPVELIIADEGDTAKSGQAAFQQLRGKDVLAISGVAGSTVMTTIHDEVEKAQIPLIGSNGSPVSLHGVVFIWRTSYVDDEPGRALAPYLQSRVKGKIALVTTDQDAGLDALSGFRFAFGNTDTRIEDTVIQAPEAAKMGAGFYSTTIQRIRSMDPEIVYCALGTNSGIEFVKQLRTAGLHLPIYASGLLTEGSALETLGTAARGIYTSLNYSSDLENPTNRRFAAAYRRAHNLAPTTFAMASFDAASVLDQAIALASPSPTPLTVNQAIARLGLVDSPRGTWQFNQSRTPQQSWYLRQVRPDGQVLANVVLNELATLG
ncbi:ABC transporter substrate-binding protein [Rhizomonospora bruguierae]|uniref:ABC transporter substrate-binding protein n=1 Tax=Rhizomonospora bruguierae TaxID=1581705 RepID=UPI001BD003EB|nr:ABC transporter substrate-binding protein [Micromonospora sp. NBRC 107566]